MIDQKPGTPWSALREGRLADGVRRHRAGLAIVVAYLVLAVCYSLVDPMYESTDEVRHVRYVRHLMVYRNLPEQGGTEGLAQSHHPPLYYALAAAASWWVPVREDVYYKPANNQFWGYRQWEVGDDNKNQYLHGVDERFPFHGITLAVYVMRWVNVLLGAGAVYLTYLIGREVFPGRPLLAAGAAAFVAFNPQFLYLSAAVNNDVAAALCSAAVLLACMRLVRAGPSLWLDIVIGCLYGLALLTKLNLLALLGPIELAYVLAASKRRDWRAYVRGQVMVLGLAGLLSAWWFWRNQVLYGDLTGMSALNELWAGRPLSESWWALRQGLPHLWTTLWGRFGYGQVPMPDAIYAASFWACLVAITGHMLPRRERIGGGVWWLLATSTASFLAAVCYYILIQPAGAMGRFLFPALPAFAALVVAGLDRIVPAKRRWMAGALVTLAMASLAIYALVGVLIPAFSRPRALGNSEIEAIPVPTDVRFADLARMVGYSVAPTETEAGGIVRVTVYWEVLSRSLVDYAVFVHLLSDTGVMITQRDTYPGLGRYPTSAWDPGVTFADTYRLHLPDTAFAPDSGYVQVGLYQPGGARILTSDGEGAVRLGSVEVKEKPGDLPNPLDYVFDGVVRLVGYDLDERAVRPGDTVVLTLYWLPLSPAGAGYSTCTAVLGGDEHSEICNPVSAAGGMDWQEGVLAEDGHVLLLGPEALPGNRGLRVTLRTAAGDPVPVVAEDGRWLDTGVLLSGIVVVADE